MTTPDLHRVKQALIDADVEIYRTKQEELHVAERIRLHIMDSGVRVLASDSLIVRFTARSQRSDFPHSPEQELFDKVREVVGSPATERGYQEASTQTVEVKDPVDENKVLDVWYEITYDKPVVDVDGAVDEVRWALEVEKYVTA